MLLFDYITKTNYNIPNERSDIMDNVNLNSLRIFLEVASSNSFLEAANRLYISQPAISKSISKLEEELSVKLFYRANKGILLTPSGEVLCKYLKETKNLLQSCERVLLSLNDTEEGNLVIGVQSHIVRNYLMGKIENFRKNHPNIKIKLIDLSTYELMELLQKRILDFVIDSSPVESIYNNIEIKPICSLETAFIKSTLNVSKIKTLKDLEKECIILPVERSSLRKSMNMIFKEANAKIIPKLEFETEELIIDSVRRNIGVGYVVKDAVNYLVNEEIIEYISLKEKLPELQINLVFVENYLTKIANLFIEEEITVIKDEK